MSQVRSLIFTFSLISCESGLNLILKWGEAAGPFLSIEPLMRYIAELHKPLQDKIAELIKTDKSTKNNQYVNYWDCNPKYSVAAIESIFGNNIQPEAFTQICKYPTLRDTCMIKYPPKI